MRRSATSLPYRFGALTYSGTAGRRLQSPASLAAAFVSAPRVAAGSAPHPFPPSVRSRRPLPWPDRSPPGVTPPSYAHAGSPGGRSSASRVTSWRGESRPGHSHSRASVASLRPRAQERPAGRSHRFPTFTPSEIPHPTIPTTRMLAVTSRGRRRAAAPGRARPGCSRIPLRSVPEFFAPEESV
jgi:hypothetical protein